MRIVAWNCCEGIAHDLPAVRALGADVAVLAEVPASPPPDSLFDQQPSWHWVHDGALGRGLAIAGFTEPMEPYQCAEPSGALSLAAQHPSGLGVLGICAREPEGSKYSAEVLRALAAHKSWLEATPGVVAGDFNLAPGRLDAAGCRAVFDMLRAMGYSSVYHHRTNEEYGSETAATYFHQRKLDQPFFIDHCFVHEDLLPKITGFEIGDYDTWVASTASGPGHSDHVPLILDLGLGL